MYHTTEIDRTNPFINSIRLEKILFTRVLLSLVSGWLIQCKYESKCTVPFSLQCTDKIMLLVWGRYC